MDKNVERVINYLKKYNLEKNVIVLNESSATVVDAANALHCTTDEIAKTLAFSINDKVILIVLSGDTKIDNAKYRKEFNTKAHMLSLDIVLDKISHPVGGVCPFAVKEDVKIYLDVSLKKHDVVYPAAGSTSSAVKLTISELETSSNYEKWIDVGKN